MRTRIVADRAAEHFLGLTVQDNGKVQASSPRRGELRFHRAAALTLQDIAAIAIAIAIGEQVRRRVLHWFARSGLLDADDARDMLAWDNGGFSLDASARIAGHDRTGQERPKQVNAQRCPSSPPER